MSSGTVPPMSWAKHANAIMTGVSFPMAHQSQKDFFMIVGSVLGKLGKV